MAKVFKVTVYVTDYNDSINDHDDLRVALDGVADEIDGFIDIAEVKESEEFEWDDELAINNTNSTNEDFEKYFEQDDELSRVKERLTEAEGLISEAHDLLDNIHGYDTDVYREMSKFIYGENDE